MMLLKNHVSTLVVPIFFIISNVRSIWAFHVDVVPPSRSTSTKSGGGYARRSIRRSTATTMKGYDDKDDGVAVLDTPPCLDLEETTLTMEDLVRSSVINSNYIDIVDLNNPDIRLKVQRRRSNRHQQQRRLVGNTLDSRRRRKQHIRYEAEKKFKFGQEMAQKAIEEVCHEYHIEDTVANVAVKPAQQRVVDISEPLAVIKKQRSSWLTITAPPIQQQNFQFGQQMALKAIEEVYKEYKIHDPIPTINFASSTASVTSTTDTLLSQQKQEKIVFGKSMEREFVAIGNSKLILNGWFKKKAPILYQCLHEQRQRLVRGMREMRSFFLTGYNTE